MRDSLAYRPFERLPPVIFADLISRMDYAVMPDGPEMDRWREVLLRQVSRRVPEGPRTLLRWLDDAIGPEEDDDPRYIAFFKAVTCEWIIGLQMRFRDDPAYPPET